jgi:RNA polymerase sigma-70 factor (ECF subfamily)
MASSGEETEKAGTQGGVFATTHWSVVLTAGQVESPQAAEALEQLCRTYWYPLYAYVRRQGHSPEDAQDLTQEFFARLLAKNWLSMADQRRGRFRSFLLTAFSHFLANEWDRAHCQKRGGSRAHLPFDMMGAEQLFHLEAGRDATPEAIYERHWALRLLDLVRRRLREDQATDRKAGQFELLERFLPGEESPLTYAQAAAQLGVPEGTLKSEVHRLKQQYGNLLRQEIAHTVSGPEEIDDELRHLITVVGR